MNVLRRVAGYFARHKFLFGLTLSLAIVNTLSNIFLPQGVRLIVDRVTSGEMAGLVQYLAWGGVALVGLYLLRASSNALRIRVNNTVEQRVLVDLRGDLHTKLLHLPVSYFDNRKSGDIASRVIEDVQEVERAVLDGTEQGSTAILMVLGVGTALFIHDWQLTLLMLAPMPFMVFNARRHSKKVRPIWRQVRSSAGDLNSLLVEDIAANRLIHSFGLQDREQGRFVGKANTLRHNALRGMYRYANFNAVQTLFNDVSYVILILFGGYKLATDPSFTVGEFTAFLFYAQMIFQPIWQLNQLVQMFVRGEAAGKRVFEILDEPIQVSNPEDPKPFPQSPTCTVRYEGVQFAYSDRASVLHDIHLELPGGRTTALVGHTGAGKSTIANLLLRYYDVSGGAVTVEGIDVREMDLTDLRRHIGYVAQDPFLFDGTVRENLELARPESTEEEMIAALEGAHAWEFVSRMPEKLDTLIGERGIRLSMGEKQRLTIARVLLKNPPLVIFDEATASVDTITEAKIQEALDNLTRERTVLVIAHRLSTVRKAHQIVVLDAGQILERGTHEELLAADGRYARLWKIQNDAIPA